MSNFKIVLTGAVVIHKAFGEGIVVAHEKRDADATNILRIDFSGTEKSFVYPTAFEKFLKAKDPELDKEIRNDMEELKQIEFRKKEEAAARTLTMQKSNPGTQVTGSARPKKEKVYTRKNIALKCNYNDGGKNEDRIGFCGVCSDPIIENNIMVEKRSWCTQPDCPCMQYYNRQMGRRELEAQCEDGGWVCYESQMLRDWKAMAGMYTSGEKKGEPMKLRNVQKNSLAVLTTRLPGGSEADRFIFAVFLVDDFDEGDGAEEGYVSTKSKFKLTFSENECRRMLFWNYHANTSDPATPAWASGLFRYISDEEAVQILRDAVKVKEGTKDHILAEEFLAHFCTINRIMAGEIGEADGALIH